MEFPDGCLELGLALSPAWHLPALAPELIWLHVASDALIGMAYFSIPIVLSVLVSRRPDIAFSWVFWAFAVFILACGTALLLDLDAVHTRLRA